MRSYFDEVWGETDTPTPQTMFRFNDLHQQPAFTQPNVRADYNASHNSRQDYESQPAYNDSNDRPYNNDPGSFQRQTNQKRKLYNNKNQQHPRSGPKTRGGNHNNQRQNWFRSNTARKRTFTNLSDDESSQRAASGGTQRSCNDFNQKMSNNLGFEDDEEEHDKFFRMG